MRLFVFFRFRVFVIVFIFFVPEFANFTARGIIWAVYISMKKKEED